MPWGVATAIAAGLAGVAWAGVSIYNCFKSDTSYSSHSYSSSYYSSGSYSRSYYSSDSYSSSSYSDDSPHVGRNFLSRSRSLERTRGSYNRYPTPEKYKLKPNTVSSYTYQSWPEIFSTIEGIDERGKPMRKIEMYSIPEVYIFWFEQNLESSHEMAIGDRLGIEDFLSKFGSNVSDKTKEKGFRFGFTAVRPDNYTEFFHDLLYIEEYENICKMEKYAMTEVPIKFDALEKEWSLEVPGLAEKRPNILKNDVVYVRLHNEPTVQYSGWVKEVARETIVIKGFDEMLEERMGEAKTKMFDVRFTCSRYTFYVQHMALDSVFSDTLEILFPADRRMKQPKEYLPSNYNIGTSFFGDFYYCYYSLQRMQKMISDSTKISLENEIKFVNPNIGSNSQQKRAVLNIVQGTSGSAPYIIFGPPGTGKTVTFVEAILQVKKQIPSSHILVCAQNNGTCDLIASKLYSSGECSENEILRLVSSNKMEEAGKEILEITKSCPKDEIEKITNYRIIVCTLITAGRIVDSNEFINSKRGAGPHTFSHLFIDEAGQASECQALIPIAGLLKGGSQLVLAGDPKQLGPVCVGKNSEKFGLGISLLERLMANFSIYHTDEEGKYDQNYLTQLVKNFRSHEDILKISNTLFYDNKLEPQGIQDDLCYAPLKENLFRNKTAGKSVNRTRLERGTPIIFHGVLGEEIRDPKSLSMWNRKEIYKVVDYISTLLSCDIENRVIEEDIGVIAPYFLQVQKIKQELQRRGYKKIEVGSTETFQGREKRAIIVSTVRSQPQKIKRYSIGFVKDPRRFNVIMTRAQAKLIVIGNPFALSQDECWRHLLQTTLDSNAYRGCQFNLNRTILNEQKFLKEFENLKISRSMLFSEKQIVQA